MRRASGLFAILATLWTGTAPAQTTTAAGQAPAAPPCSAEAYRQLDFWVGEWIATWTNADGSRGTGRNVITNDEYGACAVTERFSTDDGSFRGFSISTYFRAARDWRQAWMDDQGGYFDLFGGPSEDPRYRFVLEQYRRRDSAPYLRMVWEDVQPDSFTWRWQGRTSADAEWTDRWVIRYTRAPGRRP